MHPLHQQAPIHAWSGTSVTQTPAEYTLLLPPTPPEEHASNLNRPPSGAMPSRSRAEIRRARAARNRCSARRSRLRKKAETQRDLDNANQVERRNVALKARVDMLRNKMVRLKKIVQALGLGDAVGGIGGD